MLAEAGLSPASNRSGEAHAPRRPTKRARRQSPTSPVAQGQSSAAAVVDEPTADGMKAPHVKKANPNIQPFKNSKVEPDDDFSPDSDSDIEFEDILLPEPTLQTIERDSDSESESDLEFEDVRLEAALHSISAETEKPKALELNLNREEAVKPQPGVDRRRALTREEKKRRQDIHKVHLLCLLSHASKRNHWCNDSVVQGNLRPLLNAKTVDYFNPASHLPQFSKKESILKAAKWAQKAFLGKYDSQWEKGFWKARWADDMDDLQHVSTSLRQK